MDIRQLKYFVTIVDSGSLSKAAEILCVAQPSLSQQMSGLEVELKTQLLLRSSQGVKPTEAGKILYRRARTMLREMDHLRQEVQAGSGGETGQVAVGLPTTVATVLALPLYTQIRSDYPGIHLKIFESMSGYLTELLANNRLDMGMLYRDTETRGVSVQPLFDEDLYVIGDCGLKLEAGATACPMHLLDSVPLVLPSSSQGLRLLVERSFAREGQQLNVVADIDSLPTLIAIANSGSACTILPASAVINRQDLVRPTLRRLIEPGMRRPISLCRPNAVPINSASTVVYQVIIELVERMVREGTWTGVSLRADSAPQGEAAPGAVL